MIMPARAGLYPTQLARWLLISPEAGVVPAVVVLPRAIVPNATVTGAPNDEFVAPTL